jgi:hypothetical protein
MPGAATVLSPAPPFSHSIFSRITVTDAFGSVNVWLLFAFTVVWCRLPLPAIFVSSNQLG